MRIIKRILLSFIALPIAALVFLFWAIVVLPVIPLTVLSFIIEGYEKFLEIATDKLAVINQALMEKFPSKND